MLELSTALRNSGLLSDSMGARPWTPFAAGPWAAPEDLRKLVLTAHHNRFHAPRAKLANKFDGRRGIESHVDEVSVIPL